MLEIGCGIGRQTRGFSKMFAEVYGIDISGVMISKAKELNGHLKNVKMMKTNGLDLSDFPDNYFDFVYSYGTFQHISDYRVISSYIQEIQRVLKAGGLFKIHIAAHNVHNTFWAFAFGFIPVPSFIVNRLPFGVIDIYVRLLSRAKGLPHIGTRATVSVPALAKMGQGSGLTLLDFYEQKLYQNLVNTWCVGQKDEEQ